MSILKDINTLDDIKKLEPNQLVQLANEIRDVLIYKLSNFGGHCGSNLGIVELTIALHYVFKSPVDKFVFDVSHQCYTHKILTGRKQAFLEPDHFNDVSGYTNPHESNHDLFAIGHASTSISLAVGLAVSRDINKRKENVIAIIGDASITGGEALEALNYAGEYKGNLIIILNDNDQSIAENHGGLYKHLAELRATKGKSENNFFKSIGYDYLYVENGHDIDSLIYNLKKVKDIEHPVVVHVKTEKGKGLTVAEVEKERFHDIRSFDIETGALKDTEKKGMDITVFKNIKMLLDKNENAILFTAATPLGFGFTSAYRDYYEKRGQFIDVGIAEENAITMATGAQKNGANAIVEIFSTFFQRAYDQVFHDVALNNIPITMLVVNPGVYGFNSNTHIGMCDIQMFAHIPNITYLAPTCREEFKQMFKYAASQNNGPIAIRTMLSFPVSRIQDDTDYSLLRNKVEREGKDVALFAVGILLGTALEVADEVEKKYKKNITIINPRFLNDVDEDLCDSLIEHHDVVITIEDGELIGGYGQMIASYLGNKNIKVINHGISKGFHTKFDADTLLDEHGMSVDKLVEEVGQYLED